MISKSAKADLPAPELRSGDPATLAADIIERLMCDFAVDLVAACERHGRKLADLHDAIARLHDFQQDGLATWDGQMLSITPRGRMLVRSICALFDAYLAPDAQRHAKAI